MHNHDSRKIPSDDPIGRLEISAPAESDATVCAHEETKSNSKESIYSNWPLMSSILVYCVFAIHEMAYLEVRYYFHMKNVENPVNGFFSTS